MNSQEELVDCLWRLTEALALNRARRLSVVRDGDMPSIFCAEGSLAVDHRPDASTHRPQPPALR